MREEPVIELAMCRPLVEEQSRGLFQGSAGQALTGGSSCDSSSCSYCQGLARLRRDASGRLGCWLRRKRSRTELAGAEAADGGSQSAGSTGSFDASEVAVVPDAGSVERGIGSTRSSTKQPRVASMWDYALAGAGLVESALRRLEGPLDTTSSQASSSSCGSEGSLFSCEATWGWDPAWAARQEPPEAALCQVAAFQHPEPLARRRQSADIVCAVEFEEHGWLVATAGVAKQIRVYSLASALEDPEQPRWQLPIRLHRMPSKLSSLAWNPDQPGVVTVGDYDGDVSQIDLESGHMVAEADGHAGRRVWSVSHSLLRPHFCASASDDGTVRLWAGPGLAEAAAVLAPPSGAPTCGVQLSPFDEHALAVASSDHAVYVYDLRWAQRPQYVLEGHARAASYVRWLGRRRLASASVDATLAVWDLPGSSTQHAQHGQEQQQQACTGSSCSGSAVAGGAGRDGTSPAAWDVPVVRSWRQFWGHRNSKNFVGLAVRPSDGLLACGSEGPLAETCCYNLSWDTPLARCALAPAGTGSAATPGPERAAALTAANAKCGRGPAGSEPEPFCSAVAWQPEAASGQGMPLLAAAMSDGEVRVLGLQVRP
ncbi:hypothetical protein N2152v2_001356 [Parachlorella kessleri]